MKVNFSTTIVSDTEIRIASAESQTIFLSTMAIVPVDLEDFNRRVKLLAKKCKENKTRFSRAGARKVNEIFSDYNQSIWRYKELYSDLKEIANRIVAEGVSVPTVEDKNLELAYCYTSAMNKMFWRSGSISQVNEVNNNLNNFLQKNLADYTAIYL
jgi:hypothetical protein